MVTYRTAPVLDRVPPTTRAQLIRTVKIPRHRDGAFGGPGYSETVTGSPETRSETAEMFAAAGIVVTEEGRARARRKLDDAARRMTPEGWEASRREWLDYPDSA